MLCGPTASDDVVSMAVPELSVPLPRLVPASEKVTVPLAVEGATVAVNVTGWPFWDGLEREIRPVVVAIWFTTWETGDDVPLVSSVSPPYTAVTECVPGASEEVASVATPPLNVPLPRLVAPSSNEIVPVAFDGVTVAVKVTESPKVAGLSLEPSAMPVTACTTWVSAFDVLVVLYASPP